MRCIFTALVFFLATCAYAQHWTSLAKSPGNVYDGKDVVPYFLNADRGFQYVRTVYTINNNELVFGSGASLLRTVDGGKSWTTLPYFDSVELSVSGLSFVSLTHGYATALPLGSKPGGVFETTDFGDHWKQIYHAKSWGADCFDVYAARNAVFVSTTDDFFHSANGKGLLFTRDDGMTWDSITSLSGFQNPLTGTFQFVSGNRDSLVASVYTEHDQAVNHKWLVYSTDLGTSWYARKIEQDSILPTNMLYIPPHSSHIFLQAAAGKDQFNSALYSFYDAFDDYSTWHPSFLRQATSAWIAGNSCVMYLPNASDSLNYCPAILPTGPLLFRSTDQGNHWDTVFLFDSTRSCAEINHHDFRNLSVVGYGTTAYLCTTTDNGRHGARLYKTTDGGDGLLDPASFKPRLTFSHSLSSISPDTLATGCAGGVITIVDQNVNCSIASFDSVTIHNLGSDEFDVSRTSHHDISALPDTTVISVHPHSTGKRVISVAAHYTDDEYASIDTSFSVILMAGSLAAKPGQSFSFYVDSSSKTAKAGDTIGIPVSVESVRPDNLPTPSVQYLRFALNTDLLSPIEFHPHVSGLNGIVSQVALDSALLTLTFSDPLLISRKTLLGTLQCAVNVSDTLETTVYLRDAWMVAADSECVNETLGNQAMKFKLESDCSTAMLSDLIRNQSIEIDNIIPNPSSSSIRLSLRTHPSEVMSYEVFDALGINRMMIKSSDSCLTINVSSLPTGVYTLRIQNAQGTSGIRRFTVSR